MTAASPRRIILASRSPRRLELARDRGWDVVVVVPPEDAESTAPPRGPNELLETFVMRLAHAKAAAVQALGATGTILACDTLGEVAGVVLGKPADAADARRMLEALAGRTHRVLTGVCLWPTKAGEPRQAWAESTLEMDAFTPDFLDWYLASGLWQGKAGACGFQDERLPLRLLTGSSSNVVGLPVELIEQMLAEIDRFH